MNIFKNYTRLWMLLIASIMSCVAIAQDENYGIGDGFDPANPGNPGSNGWNAATGEVIIDDFTTGNLNNSITKIIGNSGSAAVTQIVVAGVINNTDFRVGNNYANSTLVDFSRTAGISSVPSSAYSGNTHLCSIMLPTSITDIGSNAFNGCSALTAMTCYTLTPPKVEANAFSGVADGMVVYVPSEAVDRYIEADIWKDFTILPIQETVHSLTVKLPNDIDISTFKNMTLELVNAKSGQSYRYIITEKTSYVFNNLIENTVYKAYVKNNQNNIFGETSEISVNDTDAEVTFASLSIPQNINLSIMAGGNDITSQSTVTWTDSLGNYLSQGSSLSGYAIGKKLNYSIVLPQNIVMEYALPNTMQHVVAVGGNNIVCTLSPLQKVVITGKVLALTTKSAISGAVVSASQTFGGKYSKTTNVKTDAKGQYSIEVFRVPTSVAFAAADYVSQTVDLTNHELDEFAIPDVSLKSITGATISIGFTYTSCEGETQNWFSDYKNVNYELFNVTKNRAVSQYNVQYPQIVLLEEIEDDDVLRLTATSRTNAFMPVESTATISEQRAEATFGIVELGQIHSKFTTTGNASVVGSLYDAAGKLVKTYDYANASLTISNLADGSYTLVTMGSSRLFNTIYDLSQLPQTGLTEGSDYVVNNVEVKSGLVSAISISEVPMLDESKLYYTGDNTSFTVNKPSIVAGNYLTLTGRIDFKSAYATSVCNVQMIVDLPESCEFVENSVMVGNSTSSYTLNGRRITIPMTRYTDRVRFCIIPTLGGEYAPSAFAQFDLNGETVTQPIGSANYTAKDLSISVPSTVANTSIPVSGTAIGTSNIEIYDNGVLIGQTTSLANGTWATTCELNEPYNLSFHNIIAKVTTKQGIELQSEVQECRFDMDAIQISKVTMYHWNPEMHTMFESVFDYQNPTSKPNQWTVYYPKKQFTYTIDFTNNSPDKVSNVILYIHSADGQIVPLYPTYDAQKDLWTANIDMGSSSNGYYPVNVSVDFDCDIELDSISTASLFDNAANAKSNKEIELTNIESEGNIFNADYAFGDSKVRLSGTFATTNDLPKDIEFQTDSVFDNFIIHTNCNYETNKISVYLPRVTLSYLAEQKDSISQQFYSWANSICTESYLVIEIIVKEEDGHESRLQARRAPAIVGHTFYAVMTGRRFYSMSRDAQNHFSQLEDLWNRAERLECMDDSYKDDIRAAINRLFEQYFNIKTTATFMQSSRMNPLSPLYAISYAGGWLNFASEVGFSTRRRQISNFIAGFESACPPPPPSGGGGLTGGAAPIGNGQPDDNVRIDPSGFVFESVSTNRVEGVTATIYYKEDVEDMYGDLHENIVKWDAEEYAQENPLFTDENGYYRWDVPQGLWQVKFEKEGYETTYSEWLPVPPPQLDINIAMKQNVQPTVKSARAFEDAVEMEFDKYMMPEQLTTDNIRVMVGETAVEGTVELLNEEVSYEGNEEKYASKVRFNAAAPFDATEITLMVSNRVKSYAGIRMQDDFSQTFTIEPEVREIVCESNASVVYGNSGELTVQVLPAVASAGKTVKVKSSSTMILSTDVEELTLDSEGKASLTVNGELPGTAAITYSVDGYDLSATTMVSVEQEQLIPDSPVASVASGSALLKGSSVTLSCPTSGVTIYYTTDGSCPCDAGSTKYDGTPITITKGMTLKAMAIGEKGDESNIATYIYTIRQTDLEIPLEKGWNWISHNRYADLTSEELQQDYVEHVLTLTGEIYCDSQLGYTGHIDDVSANDGIKVYMSAESSIKLNGALFNPYIQPVSLKKGWNWIGYPFDKRMSIDKALAGSNPETGDVIVNHTEGFSQYDGEKWTGTLHEMVPGLGYLMKAESDKEVIFNTVRAGIANTAMAKAEYLEELPWSVNPRKYPNVMCVIGELYIQDMKQDNGQYLILAFVDGECRGISKNADGRIYLMVHGEKKADVTFLAYDTETGLAYDIDEKAEFAADVLGSAAIPFTFHRGETTGIHQIVQDKSGNKSIHNTLGQKVKSIDRSGVYIIGGEKVVVTKKNENSFVQ